MKHWKRNWFSYVVGVGVLILGLEYGLHQADAQVWSKRASPAKQVRVKEIDGYVYVDFPAQIYAEGEWVGVQVSVARETWLTVQELMTAGGSGAE